MLGTVHGYVVNVVRSVCGLIWMKLIGIKRDGFTIYRIILEIVLKKDITIFFCFSLLSTI
jgi:hypothetical protein